MVYLPVPWEATTSYGGGTSRGPAAILAASRQVDLFDPDVLRPYSAGLHMLKESPLVRRWNKAAKADARRVIAAGLDGKGRPRLAAAARRVNALGDKLNAFVRGESERLLSAGKIVGLVGGDHATPFGAIAAAARRFPRLGILHFDAHLDARDAYEGFTWSHASIMRNVLERIPGVARLVQVGIRDFCEEEFDFCSRQGERVKIYFDRDFCSRRFRGEPFDAAAKAVAGDLPKEVWVSFDIDGLDPRFCPHTGTPVPGGLDFSQANHMLGELVRSGRRIVGFDLNEVSPALDGKTDWDANVGARLLYKLSAWTLASQGRAKLR